MDWPELAPLITRDTAAAARHRQKLAEVIGEDGLAQALVLARSAARLPDELAAMLGDVLQDIGIEDGSHVLLDNCGPVLREHLGISNEGVVVVEKDLRALTNAAEDGAYTIAGTSGSVGYPEDAFALSVVVADAEDAIAEVKAAAEATAIGGTLVVLMPKGTVRLGGFSVHNFELLRDREIRLEGVYQANIPGCAVNDDCIMYVGQVVPRDYGRVNIECETVEGQSAEERAEWLRDRLTHDVRRIVRYGVTPEVRGEALAMQRRVQQLPDFTVRDDGAVWLVDSTGRAAQVVGAGTRRAQRIAAAIELANDVEGLLDLERNEEATEHEVEQRITAVRNHYDDFVGRYGHTCEPDLQRELTSVTRTGVVLSQLERVDAHGKFADLGAVLTVRVGYPQAHRIEHADSPEEALAVSFEQTGGVDVGLLAGLLGVDDDHVADAMGDLIIDDPVSGELVATEDYLTGNVGQRLDRVQALIAAETTGRALEARRTWVAECGLDHMYEFTRNLQDWEERELVKIKQSATWKGICGTGEGYGIQYDEEFMCVGHGYGNTYLSLKVLADCALAAQEGAWDPERHPEVARGMKQLVKLVEVYARGSKAIPLGVVLALSLSAACTTELLRQATTVLFAQLDQEDVRTLVRLSLPRSATLPTRLGAGNLFDAFQREPALVEWLAMHFSERQNPFHRYLQVEEIDSLGLRNREAFGNFLRRRDAALSVEVDEERLSRLREVEGKLLAALPAPIEAPDISVSLGSPWIPAETYLQFARERLLAHSNLHHSRNAEGVRIERVNGKACWYVTYKDLATLDEARRRYGIEAGDESVTPLRLFKNAMTGTITTVYRDGPTVDNRITRVVDHELTMLAAEKRADLENDFAEWLWSDPERTALMVECYNRAMNRVVPLHYDGSYLRLPDASTEVTLHQHQKDAIARILRSREGSLIAHAVGAGKTYEGVAAVHEARRLGKCQRPLLAVPNSTVTQWASSWAELYPNDRVLVMDATASRNEDTRRRFWSAAKTGVWDAIIVPHSQFDRMNMSPVSRINGLQVRLRQIEAEIEDSHNLTHSRRTRYVASRMRERASIEEKIEDLRREERDGKGVYFDELGVDFLVVDEAHHYKRLGIETNRSVSGITSAGSKKADHLMQFCDVLRARGKGDNIVFLTGTPVTNTVCELYVMQKYLAPELLNELGTSSFNAWSMTFGKSVRSVEVKPEGGLQNKERFARFTNLPELMACVHTWCDLVTNEDMSLDLPDVRVVNVDVPPTPIQRQCMRWLEGRGDAVRKGKVNDSEDNLLVITSDGKKVALDPKLLFPDDPNVPTMYGGKMDVCAHNVFDVWQRTTLDPEGVETLGTQLVFCDSSTEATGKWNIQTEMKRRLVELGIPEQQIATVPGSLSPSKRERLFALARTGEVRVLIGSTQTLGTGVSVQERLAAIHDLDCPWRASDLEQRMGRMRRQGNSFASCDWWQPTCYRYATSGTFDAYLYQTTSRKGAFVSQVMTNDSPTREAAELSDVVLTLEEMKALASGNPAVRRRLELDNEVKALQLKYRGWSREMKQAKYDLKYRVKRDLREAEGDVTFRAGLEEAAAAVLTEKVYDEELGNVHEITVEGVTYGTDKESVGRANLALVDAIRNNHFDGVEMASNPIAQIGNMDICLVKPWSHVTWKLCVTKRDAGQRDKSYYIALSKPVRTFVASNRPWEGGPYEQIFSLLEEVAPTMRVLKRKLARLEAEKAALEQQVTTRWPLEEELKRKQAQLEALPLTEDDAVSAAQRFPMIEDIYASLTTGRIVELRDLPQLDGEEEHVRHNPRVLMAVVEEAR